MTERVFSQRINFLKIGLPGFLNSKWNYFFGLQTPALKEVQFKNKLLDIFSGEYQPSLGLSSFFNLLLSFLKVEELFFSLEIPKKDTVLSFKKTKHGQLKTAVLKNSSKKPTIPFLFFIFPNSQSRIAFYATGRKVIEKSNLRFIQKSLTPFSLKLENYLLWFYLEQEIVFQKKKLPQDSLSKNSATTFLRFSHELKTPLAIAKNLVWQELANSTDCFCEKISLSLEKIAQLAEDFSFFLKLNHEPVLISDSFRLNLSESLDEIFCDLELLAEGKKIIFKNYCSKNIFVMSAKKGIEKALRNLIFNAFIYNHSGGVVEVCSSLNKGTVRLVILDTGKGIAQKDLSFIFDLFYRSPLAKEIYPEGSGLGLPIAKKIIEKHNGTLAAESEEGNGSIFVITLPASSN